MTFQEPEYKPPFELMKTNHGVDGLDAKTWKIANFTTEQKAIDYLAARDYTHKEGSGAYAHKEQAKRHTMGQLTYRIKPRDIKYSTDPK